MCPTSATALISVLRGAADVKLGGQAPITNQNQTVKAFSDNFVAVSKAVTPSVVAITVTTSGKGKGKKHATRFLALLRP